MKKILLITTGGTIASANTSEGIQPLLNGSGLLADAPEISTLADIDVLDLFRIDSSDMQPENWLALAQTIKQHCLNYCGIIVTHGTDTMAYTSSVLSFMLRGIDIPVIITGSQLPIESENTDAKRNIYDSVCTVILSELKGVFIVFNGRIISGCKASKYYSSDFDTFRSVDEQDVGKVSDGNVVVYNNAYLSAQNPDFKIIVNPNVFLLKISPGFNPEILKAVRDCGYKAIVIEGYGLGGVPTKERSILPVLENLINHDIIVVITTQCPYGICDIGKYKVGVDCSKIGIICAENMSTEAIVTKLMWITANEHLTYNEKKAAFLSDICGELMKTY